MAGLERTAGYLPCPANPINFRSIVQVRHQIRPGEGDWENLTVDPQHLGGFFNGGDGVSRHFGKDRQQQVAEIVPTEAISGAKSVFEQAAHQVAVEVFRGQG